MVKYSGNMHGDESVGREMIIALATHLLANYGVQDRVTQLLDNTEIHLVPSMNPDGFEAVTRGNYNQVDLNRGFPGAELLGATRAELLEKPIKEYRKSQWSWQFFEQTVPLSDELRWININTGWNVIRMHFRKRLLAGEKVDVVLTSKENLDSFVITHFMIRFQSDFT